MQHYITPDHTPHYKSISCTHYDTNTTQKLCEIDHKLTTKLSDILTKNIHKPTIICIKICIKIYTLQPLNNY